MGQSKRHPTQPGPNEAWMVFLELIGLTVQRGFIVKSLGNGALIVEHPVTKASIWISVHAEDLPEQAREVLRKFFQ